MTINKDTLLQGLFGNNDNNSDNGGTKLIVKSIPLDCIRDLYSFEHPFDKSLKLDIGIEELAEQIKTSGVLEPIIVRSQCDGIVYECLAGHRRRKAAKIAGLTTIPAIIMNCSDEEAKIIVTDTNLGQRDELFPSEKAKAYKMQVDALKKQGKRNDLIRNVENANENNAESSFSEENFENKTAREIVGELNGVSAREISRYIKLNDLIPELLDIIDDKFDKSLNFSSGLEISRLSKKSQKRIYNIITVYSLTISIRIAKTISDELLENDSISNQDIVDELLSLEEGSSSNKNVLKVFNRAKSKLNKRLSEYNFGENFYKYIIDEDEFVDVIVNSAINYLTNK